MRIFNMDIHQAKDFLNIQCSIRPSRVTYDAAKFIFGGCESGLFARAWADVANESTHSENSHLVFADFVAARINSEDADAEEVIALAGGLEWECNASVQPYQEVCFVRITHDHNFPVIRGEFQPCWGTGKYREACIGEEASISGTYCVFGDNVFVNPEDHGESVDAPINLIVVKGDVNEIFQVFTEECEHFDTIAVRVN